jgi:hypothetical protein
MAKSKLPRGGYHVHIQRTYTVPAVSQSNSGPQAFSIQLQKLLLCSGNGYIRDLAQWIVVGGYTYLKS